MSRIGGSNIDSGFDKRKFRYIAVAGPVGVTAGRLIEMEGDALRAGSWSRIRFQKTIDAKATARFPGLTSFGVGGGVAAISPDAKLAVDFQLITTHTSELESTDGTPIYDARSITRAVRRHLPVLFVQLGWTKFDR